MNPPAEVFDNKTQHIRRAIADQKCAMEELARQDNPYWVHLVATDPQLASQYLATREAQIYHQHGLPVPKLPPSRLDLLPPPESLTLPSPPSSPGLRRNLPKPKQHVPPLLPSSWAQYKAPLSDLERHVNEILYE